MFSLLDAEDVDSARPDEKSILTYVASYYHTFARMKNEQKSGKRIANVSWKQSFQALRLAQLICNMHNHSYILVHIETLSFPVFIVMLLDLYNNSGCNPILMQQM